MRKVVSVDLARGVDDPFRGDALPTEATALDDRGGYRVQANIIDCANVMPTDQGYASYFDDHRLLGSIPETEVQDVLAVRTFHGITVLLALTPNGLYAACPGSADTASMALVTPTPTIDHLVKQYKIALVNGGFDWLLMAQTPNGCPSPFQWWTWAIIKNRVLLYQCGLGAIVELTDDKEGNILVNWFNPTSIIGTYKLYKWNIHAHLDTTSCTTTEQSITLDVVGTFSIPNLDKAHIAAVAPIKWKMLLSNVYGSGVIIK